MNFLTLEEHLVKDHNLYLVYKPEPSVHRYCPELLEVLIYLDNQQGFLPHLTQQVPTWSLPLFINLRDMMMIVIITIMKMYGKTFLLYNFHLFTYRLEVAILPKIQTNLRSMDTKSRIWQTLDLHHLVGKKFGPF